MKYKLLLFVLLLNIFGIKNSNCEKHLLRCKLSQTSNVFKSISRRFAWKLNNVKSLLQNWYFDNEVAVDRNILISLVILIELVGCGVAAKEFTDLQSQRSTSVLLCLH